MPDQSFTALSQFNAAASSCPLVAILRHVTPAEIEDVASAVIDEGFKFLEIPLNSPDAFKSIGMVARRFAEDVVIGAGTVMTTDDVRRISDIGGRLIVTPHVDVDVISGARDLGLVSIPGVATPSEGFAALRAGATGLKIFPAEAISPAVLSAWRAVFPMQIALMPTGGITPSSMQEWLEAGASGFGIGGHLYKPGRTVGEVRLRAEAFVSAWRNLRKPTGVAV